MSRRAAQLVSAVLAGLVAGAPFATVSHSAPEAAESCQAAPKGVPPKGGHWYYRIDQASKRKCWYIGDKKEKVARAAPQTAMPGNSASPPRDADTQQSIADARAELPLPQPRGEPDTGMFSRQRAQSADATARPQDIPRVNSVDVDADRPAFASRWPELPAPTSSPAPAPPTGNTGAGLQRDVQAAPPAAIAAATRAAADAAPAKPYGSVPMLLIVIVGALSIAGLTSAIFRLGGQRRDFGGGRRVNWDAARPHRPALADDARAGASTRNVGLLPHGSLPREPLAADDADEGMARLLAPPARHAAG